MISGPTGVGLPFAGNVCLFRTAANSFPPLRSSASYWLIHGFPHAHRHYFRNAYAIGFVSRVAGDGSGAAAGWRSDTRRFDARRRSSRHDPDVYMGNVLQAGVGQAPARQAAMHAGLPASARCVTINKVCGSGLEAVLSAGRALAAGDAELAVAGGMESMSSAPYLLPKARDGFRLGHQQVVDSLIHDGLWDPYNQLHMGSCAEACAQKYHFTRTQQDAYAAESFRRANAALSEGRSAQEITAVALAFMQELGLSHERVNVRGGAIALGHPIGCSGARILVTLLAALRERGGKRGVAAACIGGGEGLALCVELL